MIIPKRAAFAIIACTVITASFMAVMLIDDLALRLLGRTIGNKGLVASALVVYGMLASGVAVVLVQPRCSWGWVTRNGRHLAVAAVTVFLSVVIFEIGLRVIRPEWTLPAFKLLYSRMFHHRNPTSVSAYCGFFERQAVVARLNSDGLRSDYEADAFLKFPHRIVVLGDSFTFGHGVRQERVFPEVLQSELRERSGHDQVAVLNAGVISFSPLLEQRLFDSVLKKYRPTLTLLVLDLSDIGDDYYYESLLHQPDSPAADAGSTSAAGEPPGFTSPFPVARETFSVPWYSHFALHRGFPILGVWLGAPMREWRGIKLGRNHPLYYEFEVEVGGVRENNRFFILRHPLSETRPFFDRTWDYIRQVAEAAESVGSRFVLVLNPRFHHWSNRECPDNWEKNEYQLDEPYEYAFFDYFEQHRSDAVFPIVNLLPSLQATKEFPLVFRRDPHWNTSGHEFVGKALAAEIRPSLTQASTGAGP